MKQIQYQYGLVNDRNHYFGLVPILIPKPEPKIFILSANHTSRSAFIFKLLKTPKKVKNFFKKVSVSGKKINFDTNTEIG